jgi:hypothetical protein
MLQTPSNGRRLRPWIARPPAPGFKPAGGSGGRGVRRRPSSGQGNRTIGQAGGSPTQAVFGRGGRSPGWVWAARSAGEAREQDVIARFRLGRVGRAVMATAGRRRGVRRRTDILVCHSGRPGRLERHPAERVPRVIMAGACRLWWGGHSCLPRAAERSAVLRRPDAVRTARQAGHFLAGTRRLGVASTPPAPRRVADGMSAPPKAPTRLPRLSSGRVQRAGRSKRPRRPE